MKNIKHFNKGFVTVINNKGQVDEEPGIPEKIFPAVHDKFIDLVDA